MGGKYISASTNQFHLQNSQLIFQPVFSRNYSFTILFELGEFPRLLAAGTLLRLQHCPQHLLWNRVGFEGIVVLQLRFFCLRNALKPGTAIVTTLGTNAQGGAKTLREESMPACLFILLVQVLHYCVLGFELCARQKIRVHDTDSQS